MKHLDGDVVGRILAVASSKFEVQKRQHKNVNWNFTHVQPINIPI